MEQLTVKEKSGANYVLFEMTGVFNAYTNQLHQSLLVADWLFKKTSVEKLSQFL